MWTHRVTSYFRNTFQSMSSCIHSCTTPSHAPHQIPNHVLFATLTLEMCLDRCSGWPKRQFLRWSTSPPQLGGRRLQQGQLHLLPGSDEESLSFSTTSLLKPLVAAKGTDLDLDKKLFALVKAVKLTTQSMSGQCVHCPFTVLLHFGSHVFLQPTAPQLRTS